MSDSDNDLYLIHIGHGRWNLQTMYEENGVVRSYMFHIDKKIMPDEEAVMDFINTL